MDLISHLAGNKNIIWKFDVVEKLKRNNKRLAQSGYQFQFKFQLMMISMNLHNVFFILMCSYALFSTFRGSFRAALSSLQLLKGNFSGAFWPGFVTSLLRVTEKM